MAKKKKGLFPDWGEKESRKRRRKMYSQNFEKGFVEYFSDGTADVYSIENGRTSLVGHQKWKTG